MQNKDILSRGGGGTRAGRTAGKFLKDGDCIMQKTAGAPFWTQAAAIPGQYPYLAEDIRCDVAVVGGGVTGALCAYYLQKAGIDTVLLDAGVLGYGSTSVSPSMLQYEVDYSLGTLADSIGMERAVRVFRACAAAIDEIASLSGELGEDVGFSRRDCLFYTADARLAKDLREEYLLRRHNGFPVELLCGADASDKFSFPIEKAIYTVGMGGEIDPYRFTCALIRNAVENGLRVFENTPVETVTAQSGGLRLETGLHCSVTASRMINATGLAAAKDAGNLAAMRTSFCVVTQPVSGFQGWYSRCLIRDDDHPYTYLHTTSDSRLLIGGLDSSLLDARGNFAGLLHMPAVVQRKYERLERRLTEMFPGIPDIRGEYRFAGIYGETCDGLPYIGEHAAFPLVYYAVCTGANGVVFAALAARIIRDLVLGRAAEDAELFSFSR